MNKFKNFIIFCYNKMSLNHINTNELDANFKSLKVNNIPIVSSATTQEFLLFGGLLGSQAVRYLLPSGSGLTATAAQTLENQISPFKTIKIVGMICRKSNSLPSTDFILYKSNLTLTTFTDLQTINVPSGFTFGTSLVLNIPIASGECLWVRSISTGTGNPNESQVTITYEQV
jgi:hypothetical protein